MRFGGRPIYKPYAERWRSSRSDSAPSVGQLTTLIFGDVPDDLQRRRRPQNELEWRMAPPVLRDARFLPPG